MITLKKTSTTIGNRIWKSICNNMDNQHKPVRHYHPIELDNNQRLEAASMMDQLRDAGIVPENINLGKFITACYFRGLNEYRKELVRDD